MQHCSRWLEPDQRPGRQTLHKCPETKGLYCKAVKRVTIVRPMEHWNRRTVLIALGALPGSLLIGCQNKEKMPAEAPDMALPPAPPIGLDSLDATLAERCWTGIERGVQWLLRSQREDGAFISRVYPVLGSGQSLTPFSLWSLLQLPPSRLTEHRQQLQNAQRWILDAQQPSGALGFRSRIEDYPCYATSLALRCTLALKPAGWRVAAERMAQWLNRQQFLRETGWGEHPAEGGWGMGSAEALTPPKSGHVDLSMTCSVLEALTDPERPTRLSPERRDAARGFVLRCQVRQGGFFSSPVLPRLNKGVAREDGPGPYGSATCDGLLALLALGYPKHHPTVNRSLAYLHSIHRVDRNPGIDPGINAALGEGMKGYYRAAAARVFAQLGGPPRWRDNLARIVLAEQRRDGSWLNKNRLQNEDEPMVATSLALRALNELLQVEVMRRTG